MATASRPTATAGAFRVPKTAELVATFLRNQIVRGELAEGDLLPPEAELIAEFGVSRPTLREAFRVLESESLITIRKGSLGGARVHGISPTTVARHAGLLLQARGTTIGDLYQCRMVLEPVAARMMAERGSKEAIAPLRRALDDQAEAMAEAPAYPLAVGRFHQQVLALCGNNTLAALGGMLTEIMDLHHAAAVERGPMPAQAARGSLNDHARLVALIEAGDGNKAETFWRRHLQAAAQSMLQGLGGKRVLDLLT